MSSKICKYSHTSAEISNTPMPCSSMVLSTFLYEENQVSSPLTPIVVTIDLSKKRFTFMTLSFEVLLHHH
jgi:hypothetical protein